MQQWELSVNIRLNMQSSVSLQWVHIPHKIYVHQIQSDSDKSVTY